MAKNKTAIYYKKSMHNNFLTTEGLIKKLTEYFQSEKSIRAAILYGSFASGKQTSHSDIDLGVYLETPLTVEMKEKIISDLALQFHRPIDVLDLNNIHVPLSQEVLTKGIWIKLDEKPIKERLVKKMIYEVADFLPLKTKMQLTKIKRFINK